MEVKKFTLSVIMENKYGVLMRVVSLFSKRGFNIDTLTVAPMAEDNNFSRAIITSEGDDATREQIVKQLQKLPVVVRVAQI